MAFHNPYSRGGGGVVGGGQGGVGSGYANQNQEEALMGDGAWISTDTYSAQQGGVYYGEEGEDIGGLGGGVGGMVGDENGCLDGGGGVAPQEGTWLQQTACQYEPYAVTALAYDPNCDRLWSGYQSGRVCSLLVDEEEAVGGVGAAQMYRYSSFLTDAHEPVLSLLPVNDYVFSICTSKIRMHTDGGLPINTIPAPEKIVPGSAGAVQTSFTCGALIRQKGALVTAENTSGPTHLAVGTGDNVSLLFDLAAMYHNKPLSTFDTSSPTVKIISSGTHLIIAGSDGKIRLYDGRLRSSTVQHVLDAHTGPVLDVCVQQEGSYNMLSCGLIARPINPADPKSPARYVPDPLVRIFDLRTNRQMAPISMATASPAYARFLPTPNRESYNLGATFSQVLLAAANGVMQVSEPSPAASLESTQILYCPLTTPRETVTSVAVSSSGQCVAVGTSAGMVSQFVVSLSPMVTTKHMINTESIPVIPPPFPPTPLLSLSSEAPVVGTSYVLKPKDHDMEPLLSSYYTTPYLREKKMSATCTRRIGDDLMRNLSVRDWVGTVSNPGYPPNSMIFTPSHSYTHSTTQAPYAVCDPRLLEQRGENGTDGRSMGGRGSGGRSGNFFDRRGGGGGGGGGGGDQSEPIVIGAGLAEATGAVGAKAPITHRKQVSFRGKQRMQKFNYRALNNTGLVGLENNLPHAYTNSILQLLYCLPEVREVALSSQSSAYHHNNPITMWCELGFLFHMILSIEKEGSIVPYTDLVITPSNFTRTLQQVPEAVALGLFEANPDPQALVQPFIRLLFQQLHKESDLEGRNPADSSRRERVGASVSSGGQPGGRSPVDEIFGHTLVSTTTFLVSGKREVGAPNRALTLELAYPSTKPGAGSGSGSSSSGGRKNGEGSDGPSSSSSSSASPISGFPYANPKPSNSCASFAAAMWGSLRKETSMRGWCAASEQYEPFKQVRSIVSIPRVLAVLCGDTQRDPKDMTVSGALGEANWIGGGTMQNAYWSKSSCVFFYTYVFMCGRS